MRKLKFYLLGLIPGLIFVGFIFNKKGATCSGYLPSSRVVAETLSKDFHYTEAFKKELATLQLDEKTFKEHIIKQGEIDFQRSHAQKQPCPDYLLLSPAKNAQYEVTFEKCPEGVTFRSIKKLP